MSERTDATTSLDEDAARAFLFAVMAVAFGYPSEENLMRLASSAADLEQALRTLGLESPGSLPEVLEDAAARHFDLQGLYNRLFVTGLAAPISETAYELDKSARRAAELADVQGFYRAFGLRIGAPVEPDHLVAELEFLSALTQKSRYFAERDEAAGFEVSAKAYRDFLEDHLGRWYGIFCERLEAATEDPFYRLFADLLRRLLDREITRLGLEPLRLSRYVSERPGPSSWCCGAGPGASAPSA